MALASLNRNDGFCCMWACYCCFLLAIITAPASELPARTQLSIMATFERMDICWRYLLAMGPETSDSPIDVCGSAFVTFDHANGFPHRLIFEEHQPHSCEGDTPHSHHERYPGIFAVSWRGQGDSDQYRAEGYAHLDGKDAIEMPPIRPQLVASGHDASRWATATARPVHATMGCHRVIMPCAPGTRTPCRQPSL